jgi:hypothetical protein
MAEFARPRVVGLNHAALEVGDIDEALAFYGRLAMKVTIEVKKVQAAMTKIGVVVAGPGVRNYGSRPAGCDLREHGRADGARSCVQDRSDMIFRRDSFTFRLGRGSELDATQTRHRAFGILANSSRCFSPCIFCILSQILV